MHLRYVIYSALLAIVYTACMSKYLLQISLPLHEAYVSNPRLRINLKGICNDRDEACANDT